MPDLRKHIGVALLGGSFVLFLLWALPYVGGIDTFGLAASASQGVGFAPEHMQLESQIHTLLSQYASDTGENGIKQLETDLLATTNGIFGDENPDESLSRGDAAYLVAIYASVRAKPCIAAKDVCAQNGAAATPDLKAAREYTGHLTKEKAPFADVSSQDWYGVYVAMLSSLHVLDAKIDAPQGSFAPHDPVAATDLERWFSRVDTGADPATLKSAPGATLTKKQGVTLLQAALQSQFAAKAARR